jgi:hypothetical protein
LVIFEIGSHIVPRPAWTVIPLFVLSCIAGVTSECHHTQPLTEMGSLKVFAQAASQVARITDLSHSTQPVPAFF